jgi:gamma-glutamyltranspeptidase/glutathione hydrolase
LLRPAIALATDGFPASPLLLGTLAQLDATGQQSLHELVSQARRPADRVRRPGVARALQAIAEGGRAGFYEGEFGRGLLQIGNGWFEPRDLSEPFADWVTPLRARAWDTDLFTIPPNSQGYLTLGSAALVADLDLPADPDDPLWAHLLIEAATAAGYDRPQVLHEHADGDALLAAIAGRGHMIDHDRASRRPVESGDGDTTYLCTADGNGVAVSLIQSNASGFGSWVVEPNTQINLHNRGLGFSLQPGHPAELGARKRPPHTLSPALATDAHGLRSVFGTMGGDGQPQVLLQLATRLFHHGQTPAEAINAGRWVLRGPVTGFDTWTAAQGPDVMVEGNAPADWVAALAARGHRAIPTPPFDSTFGHAHAIVRDDNGWWASATEPRTRVGSAAGL